MSTEPEITNKHVSFEPDHPTQIVSRDAFYFLVEFVTEGEKHQKHYRQLMKEVQESLDAWYEN